MPIIQNNLPKNTNISFKYSCTLELVCSLHVISNPGHHSNCMYWYENAVSSIDRDLMLRILNFGSRYAEFTFVMDLIDNLTPPITGSEAASDDFAQVMQDLENFNTNEFIYIFLGGAVLGEKQEILHLLDVTDQLNLNDFRELPKYIALEDAEEFLRSIPAVRRELMEILWDYYHAFFKAHWDSTYAFYKSALLKEEKHSISLNYILSLHDDLLYKNGTLIMKKNTQFMVKAETINNLCIIFSFYTYPHLMINIFGNRMSVYENLVMPNLSLAYDDIAVPIKILGDATRLAIIKILSQNESTNKSLSILLNVSPASISQHLKILKEHDLLLSRRKKNSIFYSLNKNRLSEILKKLNLLLSDERSEPT